MMEKCSEVMHWLDENQDAETDEFEEKLKEIEGVYKPIIKRLHEVLTVH